MLNSDKIVRVYPEPVEKWYLNQKLFFLLSNFKPKTEIYCVNQGAMRVAQIYLI